MIQKFTFLLFLIISTNFALGQNSFKDIVAKNEKAIFSIFTYDNFGVPNGSGTGFFISNEGVGITNYNLLKNVTNAIIKTSEEKTYRITEILEINAGADLVKFKVENNASIKFPYLTKKIKTIQKGENIFVIGNSHGHENTISEGIISSIRKIEGYEEVIQITAPILPGSSGSPVMTLDGEVVAITTFHYSEGQNLNFAVSSKMIDKLIPQQRSLTKEKNRDFIIINERSKDNSELVLNSIEFKNSETVLNFSFTNVSMGYGPSMLIWTKLNSSDETFFIQDLQTLKKYYAKGSTIGNSRENGTEIALGETKRFSISFAPIPKDMRKVNIMEGLTSSWNFINLDFADYLDVANQEINNFDLQYALAKLETQDFQNAKMLLSNIVESNKGDHETYNVLGIISYIMDNNFDALKYLSMAIEINPRNDIYYFNRYRMYYERKQDMGNALQDISMAIINRPSHGDYYLHRAYTHMELKNWKKAVSDFDIAINLMGEGWTLLKYRGIAKTWLDDFDGACRDFKDAYNLSNFTDKELNETIKNYCK